MLIFIVQGMKVTTCKIMLLPNLLHIKKVNHVGPAVVSLNVAILLERLILKLLRIVYGRLQSQNISAVTCLTKPGLINCE